MTIVFSCANCGKKFELDHGFAGKKGKCKQCGHIFVIPTPTSRPRPVATNQPVQKSREVEASRVSSPSRSGSVSARSSARGPEPEPYVPAYADDAIDRFGLDDPPPTFKRAAPAYAVDEDDELLAPERVRPTPSRPEKRQSWNKERRGFWDGIPGMVYLIIFGLLGLGVILAVLSPATAPLLIVSAGVSFLVLWLYAAIGLLVIPFQESAACGLMCLFVPFYALYYTITRWDAMRGPFLSGLASYGVVMVGAVLLPAISAGRQAAQRAVEKERQAAARRQAADDDATPAVPAAERDDQAPPGADNPALPAPDRPAFAGRNRQPFAGRNRQPFAGRNHQPSAASNPQGAAPGFPGLAAPPPTGGTNAITVIVTGISDDQAGKEFSDKLTNLAKRVSQGFQFSNSGGGGKSTYQITPLNPVNVQAFADQITWAKVTRVRGRTIEVDASAAPDNEQASPDPP